MNVKHLGLIAVTAVVAAGLAGMSTSNAGAAVTGAKSSAGIVAHQTAVHGNGLEHDHQAD